MTFPEIETLLTALGWTIPPGNSSHVMLVSPPQTDGHDRDGQGENDQADLLAADREGDRA
jgi:hypothetical protein